MRRHQTYIRLLALLLNGLVVCGYAQSAQALVTDWAEQEHSQLRVIVGDMQTLPGGQDVLLGGLHFTLEGKWKNYWRNAGDAGLPPRVTLMQSENIDRVEVLFPAPERYIEGWGLEAYGYHEEVVYPLAILRSDNNLPAEARLKVDYMVCDEICIPYTEHFSLNIPAVPALDEADAVLLERYVDRLPGAEGKVVIGQPTLEREGGDVFLLLPVKGNQAAPQDIFVEGLNGYAFAAPVKGENGYRLPLREGTDGGALLDSDARITWVGADEVAEADVRIARGASWGSGAIAAEQQEGAEDAPDPASLVTMLVLAFIGGLILNIMPCVLPVLSLKLMSVMRHHERPGAVRAGFLVSALGVVLSFMALAAVAVSLKSAGMAVGWGLHFQEPLFVGFMAVVIALFAADLWGFFEIQLPMGLTGKLHELADEADQKSPWLGHFISGVFATLLATPCTAPFLGTAVGFALSGSNSITFLLFAVMGLGLAFPYLIVAAFPRMVEHMPRPGRWMRRMKHILGWLLFFTALWLLWILAMQVEASTAWVVMLSLGLLLFWLARRSHAKPVWVYTVFPILMMGFAVAWGLGANPLVSSHNTGALEWQAFDEARIPVLVAEGKTVFVDVTADWCLTCKFNKLAVLDTDAGQALLGADDVVAMQADWTNRDEAIGAYLKQYERYGIPFNIVYGPEAAEGIALSELLTLKDVQAAIEAARP